MRGVIITGTSKGLGNALLATLLSQGYFVISVSKTDCSGKHKSEKLNHFTIDLSKILTNEFDFLEKIIVENKVSELFFVNNAGDIRPIDLIGNFSNDFIYQSVHLNLAAPMLITNNIIRMEVLSKIVILNISSGAASKAIAGWANYCTTKAAMIMFFDVLIEENKHNSRIKVFNIDPGVMDTEMQEYIRKSDDKKFPLVDKFKDYKEKSLLMSPDKVAGEIVKKFFK